MFGRKRITQKRISHNDLVEAFTILKEDFTEPCTYNNDVRDSKKIRVPVFDSNEKFSYSTDLNIFDVVQTLINQGISFVEDPTSSSRYKIRT